MITEARTDIIVRRHRLGVWRYLRLLGCDGPTADDLAQETFLALMRTSFEDRDPRATAAWLRRKARFIFLEHIRKNRRRRETRLADMTDAVWDEYAGDDGGEGYRHALRECLALLPPRSRQVIEFRYGGGVGRDEIAERIGLKPNGVKTLLQRIRAKLRQCVEGKLRR
jgi:RNA polymerase sigma-70 factor, ECF subfamily